MSLATVRSTTSTYHVFRTSTDWTTITVRSLLLRLLAALVIFFGLVVIAALLVALSPTLSRSITSFFIRQQSGAVPWNGTDPVNMVIGGLDERPGQPGQFPHTDTLMVLSVDPHTDAVRLLSIPRDLWVNIPGYGVDRVNDAFGDGGSKLLMQTAEGIANLPIRYYAIINFVGFERVIDAAGGVTVDVKHAIYDPTYPAMTGNGYAPLRIRAGVQHMDGKLALEYVRTRHDDPLGDLGRNQRQQQVLEALKQQLLGPATVFRLPGILSALGQAVDTNFPYTDFTYLSRLIVTAPSSQVHREALNYANDSVTNFTTPGGAEVLDPNWPRIHWIAHLLFRNPMLAGSPIQVLNGSGITGQAGSLAQWMHACGFRVASIGNASSSSYVQTEVIRNTTVPGSGFVGRMLADLLQTREIERPMPSYSEPYVVIVGSSWNDPAQS